MNFYNVEQAAVLDPIIKRYRHPWLFFFLATAIPWALWFTAGYLSRQVARTATIDVVILVCEFAGLLAPVVVAAVLAAKAGLVTDVVSRLTNIGQIRPSFGLFALFGLPAALLIGTGISVLLGYSPDQFLLRGGFTFTSGIVPPWIPLALAPILEELAWHGYGTDALVSRWSVFKASMIFAVMWVLWHLPLASIKNYYQAEIVETGWLSTLNFMVSIFPFMILMNWIYYRCDRNIIITIVFHLAANFGNEIFNTHPDTKAIQTAILLVVSGFVLWHDRKLFFTRPQRKDTGGQSSTRSKPHSGRSHRIT
ncbi:MAG: CPBP family intramembrane metalloprotease domain-containing protein [Actinomycetales bacterium]|nr:MAG: CPBP family intramembrane metalloprotease domain-containing protein [Actinomycetales bacterium]